MSDRCEVGGSHRFQVGGHALHVEVRGAGPPLLLLHGFTGSVRSFDGIIEGLATRHRTIAVDLLGHGCSDAPDDPAVWSMARCVRDLVRVLELTDAVPAHLLGYSMGGRVALQLAVSHPEWVASLILVGASAGLQDARARAARRRQDAAWADLLRREGLEPFVERWTAQALFASERGRGTAHAGRLRAERLANRPEALARSLEGLGTGAQRPLHGQLALLHRPVLLVAGEHDAKFRAIAADLAARLPRARTAVVAGAGHAAHRECSPRFLAIASRFLADPERAVRGPRRSRPFNPMREGDPIREQP